MDRMIDLQQQLRAFAEDRDWGQFHSPKNLAMALIAECAEVVEHFQWMTDGEIEYLMEFEDLTELSHELADVLIYLTRLADVLDVDLLDAAFDKLEKNRERFPAEEWRGRAR